MNGAENSVNVVLCYKKDIYLVILNFLGAAWASSADEYVKLCFKAFHENF